MNKWIKMEKYRQLIGRKWLLLLMWCGCIGGAGAQITLSLEKTITLAADSSLDAFRYKNIYLADYWQFRTYQANRLPSLSLNMMPAHYNRYFTHRSDSEQACDVYTN